mgnify:CR=1 FL=1
MPACAFGEGGIQFAEHACAAVGKCAVHQAFHHALCARLRREDGVRVVAVLLQTRDLIGAGAEDIFILRAACSAISMFAPSSVPSVTAPFSMNFMLLVPDASVPAVEICSDTSAAGMIFSA